MKKNRGKLIFIILCILLSGYFLYPTYQDYQFTKSLRSLVGEDSLKYVEQNEGAIRDARLKRIKLGLDIQGGMRVVLEVNVLKLLEDVAKNKDDQFNAVINEVRLESHTSDEDLVDIMQRKFQQKQLRAARYFGNLRDSDDDIFAKLKDETNNAVDRAIEIVNNRIDQYGVSEPSIQKQGGRRIIVELPGVSNESEVRQLLQGTALLEFKLLGDPEIMAKVYQAIDTYLAGKPIADSLLVDTTQTVASNDTTAKTPADTTAMASNDTSKATDTSLTALNDEETKTPEQLKKEHPFFSIANPMQQQDQGWSGQLYSAEEDRPKVMRILEKPEIQRFIPNNVSFVWSAKPAFASEGKQFFALYSVKKEAELTGGVIEDAQATIDPNFNTPIVNMSMSQEGAREWARITGANIKKQIAIILDNACFSAPVVNQKITGGNSQIEGMDNVEEAKLLEIVLKAGALPAPVEIIQQTSVGPSLGEDSIRQGIIASLLSLLLTIAFMIFYYRAGGTIADVALFLNMLFMLAVLAAFQGTLTLPGIAGIILSMGVAIDANVLIFERIREEIAVGKTFSAAVDAGYDKAFSAIFDSNLTTFITGVILYQFGTGPVQGFALTLMIGIVVSMFTAIVGTRVIFNLVQARGKTINVG